jgi:phage tail-like protein
MPRVDPYRNYSFLVEVDGITQAGFAECTGFGANTDPIEYREGNEKPLTVRKLPGLTKYSNITLKWGITDSRDLYDWYTDITKGKIERKNGSIVLRDTDGMTEKIRWNFTDGWPCKWDGPDFNAKGTDAAIQTMEICHEGITQVTP